MELEMEAEKICLQLPISAMSSKAIQRNVFLPQLASWKGDRAGRGQARSELYWEESCEWRCILELQGLLMLRGMMGLLHPGMDRERKSEDLLAETATLLEE